MDANLKTSAEGSLVNLTGKIEAGTEKQKLYDTFLIAKTFIATVSIVIASVLSALYAMKDRFTYILTGLILWMIYLVVVYRTRIIKEIESRR